MKISTVYSSENTSVFRLQDVSPSYINTLRRYAASRVPTMAIDFVEFKDNSGILYDEMVAHRMGLIPLTTDLGTYRLPQEEWTEPTGDARSEVEFTLSVQAGKDPLVVKASDLKGKDPAITPVFADIPITKLIQGQALECTATARLGIGEEHAKWSPGHIWYRHFPHITLTQDISEDVAQQFPKVFTIQNGKVGLTSDAAYHLPDIELDGVSVEFEDGDYLFIIESWGQLPPKTIFEQAINAYNDQLNEFEGLSEGLNEN